MCLSDTRRRNCLMLKWCRTSVGHGTHGPLYHFLLGWVGKAMAAHMGNCGGGGCWLERERSTRGVAVGKGEGDSGILPLHLTYLGWVLTGFCAPYMELDGSFLALMPITPHAPWKTWLVMIRMPPHHEHLDGMVNGVPIPQNWDAQVPQDLNHKIWILWLVSFDLITEFYITGFI